MLSTIGEAPVDSLTGATSSDAALADQVLTEVARETLVQGWYFNLDKKDWLYRDGFGNIFLPANTARAYRRGHSELKAARAREPETVVGTPAKGN